MTTGEFDKSLDYLPEAIFTIVPRAQLVAIFEAVLKSKELKVKFIGFDNNVQKNAAPYRKGSLSRPKKNDKFSGL